ncbi:MAG TPA: multiheme c-type cytochrome [Candidatus Eisenbacteria bacterium]|nr:multiheme c-type cytochrome [Candidatus Eisenbacteria bacterium]
MRPPRFTPTRVSVFLLLVALALVLVGYTPPPLFRQDMNLQEAATCKNCHLGITEQWELSAHSKSERSNNQLFGRMYFQSLRITRGATMVSCGPCHEPTTFVNQDFNFIRDVSKEGVTCVFCHMVSGPGPSTGNPPLEIDPSKYYGTIRTPVPTTSHQSAYSSYYTHSGYCGSCHEYKNQNGVVISETYTEWKASGYAKQGITCQKCHMPGGPGRNSVEGPPRPRVANHTFDPNVLYAARPNAAATVKVQGAKIGGDSLRVSVVVTNTGWGHSLPTGNDQNLALIRLRVLSGSGAIVWENDPFADWNTSIFGVILEDELGNWPAETWTATRVISNRRIKAGGSATARYRIPLESHTGPYRVEAQLLFRRARPQTLEAYGLPEETYGTERVLAEGSVRIP